jgi:hypothetical protein
MGGPVAGSQPVRLNVGEWSTVLPVSAQNTLRGTPFCGLNKILSLLILLIIIIVGATGIARCVGRTSSGLLLLLLGLYRSSQRWRLVLLQGRS